jgi:nitrogen fixation protein FixH
MATMMPRDQIGGDGCDARKVTGRTVFACLVAFFAVVGLANAILVRAAVSTFGGLETESSYQAGLVFANEEAQARAQDALHWRVAARFAPPADSARRLMIDVRDVAGRPLRGLVATARLVHPADQRGDHPVALGEVRPGEFSGAADAPAGQWDLVIELARDGTRVFRSRNRIVLH